MIKIQGIPKFSICGADTPENAKWEYLDDLELYKLPQEVKECWVEIN